MRPLDEHEQSLFDRLPAAAQAPLRVALAHDDPATKDAVEHSARALGEAGFPLRERQIVFPLASTLTEAQRALLELTCLRGLWTWPRNCPGHIATRRRWLGLDPPSVLESESVDVVSEGRSTREPWWRAMQLASPARKAEILDALPLEVLLKASTVMVMAGGYEFDTYRETLARVTALQEVPESAKAWAIDAAERYPVAPSSVVPGTSVLIFLLLVRAGVPIEPQWDHLFPGTLEVSDDVRVECTRALPAARRTAVLVPALKVCLPLTAAFRIIAEFPSAELVEAALAQTRPLSVRWKWTVENLRAIGKTHPVVAQAVEAAVRNAPKPMKLFVASRMKPERVEDLSELQQAQLRISARGYDEQDLPLSARFAADDSETSFRGFIEYRAIVDAKGTPLYDAWLYMVDAGSLFKAGTTDEIGGIGQGGVILHGEANQALREALQVAVGPRPLEAKRAS